MKKPADTTREAQEHPERFLADAIGFGTSNAVELQEAQGQKELVESQHLPRDMRAEDRAALEEAGFEFLGTGDDMFELVKFPPGWELVANPEHSMWSHLFDGSGKKRGSIFYKAAFYDRSAHFYMEP